MQVKRGLPSRPARLNTSRRKTSHNFFLSSRFNLRFTPSDDCSLNSFFAASLRILYSYAVVAAAAKLTK